MLFLSVSVFVINRQPNPKRSDILIVDTRLLSSDEDLRSQSAFKGFALHRMAEDHSPLADESGWSVLANLLVL